MKPEQVDELSVIVKKFEPSDRLSQIAWLFNEYHPRLPEPESQIDYTAVDKRREQAIREVYLTGGPQAILSLIHVVKMPRFIAFGAAEVMKDPAEFDVLIDKTLGKGDPLDEFAIILSALALGSWKDRMVRPNNSTSFIKGDAKPRSCKTFTCMARCSHFRGDSLHKWASKSPTLIARAKQVRESTKYKDVIELAIRQYLEARSDALAAMEPP